MPLPCPECGNLGVVWGQGVAVPCPRGCPDVRPALAWPPYLKLTADAVPDENGKLWVPIYLGPARDNLLVYFPFVRDGDEDVVETRLLAWNAVESRPARHPHLTSMIHQRWLLLATGGQ